MFQKALLAGAVFTAALGSCSCSWLGSKAVRAGRPQYNQAILDTTREQLLLNLVRCRYRDDMLFLNVASVSTNFEFEASGSAAVNLPSGADDTWDLGAGGRLVESPTITYTPLSGESYVKSVLSPLEMQTLVLLLYSGWKIDRVFRICLSRFGGVENAPGTEGPTPSRAPEFRGFLRATQLLRELQKSRALRASVPADDPAEFEVRVDDTSRFEWQELASIVGFPATTARIRLTLDPSREDPTDVEIVTRSMAGALHYLSHGVQPPTEHEEAGLVTVTMTENHERFCWSEVLDDLFLVRFSSWKPGNAAVSVPYRGGWFYIDDADLSAKSTFVLLNQMFQLNSGGAPSTGPILTLPVSR